LIIERPIELASFVMLLLLMVGCTATQKTRFVPVEEAGQISVKSDIPPQKIPKDEVLKRTPVEQNSDAQVFSLDDDSPVEMVMISAIDKLTDEAEQLQRRGDLKNAATTLERALRIEPRNPHLWNRLAQIHMQQKEFKLAGDLAARSNALTQKGAAIRHDNWRIIADVRRNRRDFAGAEEADNRAATLQ